MLTCVKRNQYGSSHCRSDSGAQYVMLIMACMVSTVLTEVAIDHLMFPSAKATNAEQSSLSRARSDIAQPSAHITEKSVNEEERTNWGVCRIGSSIPTNGLRYL